MSNTPGPGAFPPLEIQDTGTDSPTKHVILAHQQNLANRQNLAKRICNLNRTTKETNFNIPPPLQPSVPLLQSRPSSRIIHKLQPIEVNSEVASSNSGASIYTHLELPKNATFVEVQAARLERFSNNKGNILQLEKKVNTYTRDIAKRFNKLQYNFHSLREDISQGFAQLLAKFDSFDNQIGRLEEIQRKQQQYQPQAQYYLQAHQPSEAFDKHQFHKALNSLHRPKQSQPFRPITPLQQRRPSAPPEQFYYRYTPSPNPFHNSRPPSYNYKNPYEDRYYQETTYNTSSTRGNKSDSIKIKRKEVGQFNPLYKDPNNLGVVVDGKNLIYTNVHCFIDHINTFIEDATTHYNAERQILGIFQTLLGGSIVIQQTNELIAKRYAQLRKIGLEYILQELRIRFDTNAGIATRRFNNGIVTLKDIVKDNIALLQYIQKMLRYARSTSLLNNNNSNQYSPIITI